MICCWNGLTRLSQAFFSASHRVAAELHGFSPSFLRFEIILNAIVTVCRYRNGHLLSGVNSDLAETLNHVSICQSYLFDELQWKGTSSFLAHFPSNAETAQMYGNVLALL